MRTLLRDPDGLHLEEKCRYQTAAKEMELAYPECRIHQQELALGPGPGPERSLCAWPARLRMHIKLYDVTNIRMICQFSGCSTAHSKLAIALFSATALFSRLWSPLVVLLLVLQFVFLISVGVDTDCFRFFLRGIFSSCPV